MGDPTPPPPPTRARLVVLGFLCTLSFVLYLDRVCIAQAGPEIQERFDISNTDWGVVLMAFTLAYGLFEIPVGHWGDRRGSRMVLTRIVAWWSAFTALTAACWGWGSLVVVRFLFGAGEAGAYPNVARVIRRWFPAHEQARVQGLFMAGSMVGAVFAPTLFVGLLAALGWRGVFVAFGAVGVAWAVAFAWWFRDDPHAHPAVNAGERAVLPPPDPPAAHPPRFPWREALRHRTLLLLGLIIACASFNSYLYFSWYPKYLQAARGVEKVQSGHLTSLALSGGIVGMLASGFVLEWVSRGATGPALARRRRWLGTAAFVSAAFWIGASTQAESPALSAALVAVAGATLYAQQTVWWGTLVAISGRNVGGLFGAANGMGVVGAMASQFFFGWFSDFRKAQGFTGRDQYDPAFAVYVAVLLLAAVCWQFVDPTRPVTEEPRA